MSEGFVQRDGELPRIEGTPNASAFKEPYPYFEFRQNDNLPYIIGTPEPYAFESPTPYVLYMQKDGMYDGLPYLNFPKMYEIFTKPLPYIYFHPNKAKKKQYTIIVSNYSEKITVPDYRMEIIGKYPSMKRGDLI